MTEMTVMSGAMEVDQVSNNKMGLGSVPQCLSVRAAEANTRTEAFRTMIVVCSSDLCFGIR